MMSAIGVVYIIHKAVDPRPTLEEPNKLKYVYSTYPPRSGQKDWNNLDNDIYYYQFNCLPSHVHIRV